MTSSPETCGQFWGRTLRLSDVWNEKSANVRTMFGHSDQTIKGLTCDSRRVEPGFLFAALPGSQVDGRDYILDAMARGAIAVLAPEGTDPGLTGPEIPLLTDPNPRRRYSLAAAQFFVDQPSSVMAVTGTNGKTSVVGFVRQIMAGLGHKSASAGTLGVELSGFDKNEFPDLKSKFHLTTPDSVDLHRSLAELASFGIDHLAIEASSHGLDQYRLDGIKISAGAFTNLSRDHLDYHGTVEDYLAAKTRLFSELIVDGGSAVINADDLYAGAFRSAAQARGLQTVSYGKHGDEIALLALEPVKNGQQLSIRVFGSDYQIQLPLVGAFQAANALCALGLVIALGENVDNAVHQLEQLDGISGRLERVAETPNGSSIFVDYAHTPDALAQVLDALRPHTDNKLHVVFGCGGDRDKGKRPEMGAVAARLADRIYLTDDNPRTEDPSAIRAQARVTCPDATEIADRYDAISAAVNELGNGDVLVVAGKGHETGQIVGDQILPFDDKTAVIDIVAGAGS